MKKFTGFNLHMYTEIVFGRETEKQVASMVKKHGGTKVMLVYGGGSIKRSGLYDTVTNALNDKGVPFVELRGVKPNPLRSFAYKGLDIAKKEKVDFVLGVGGGSVIDTAKAIAIGLVYDGDIWDLYSGKAAPTRMHNFGAVNTISAAGSETSGATVLVDDIDGTYKKAIMYPNVLRPVFAIMNPELTYTVSAYQTAAGAIDMFSHTFERFFIDSSSYLGDQFAAGVLRTVIKYAPVAIAKPDDYEARAELMLAGAFSHNDITSIGRSGQTLQVHGLEAYLSGAYDTAHGAGLAMLMPAWLEYVVENGGEERIQRVAEFAEMVFDVEDTDHKMAAYKGIRKFRLWIKSIGMPLCLKDLNIPEKDIPEIVKNCRSNAEGILKGYLDLDKKAVEAIYRRLA
jgi:hypothetical protein